MAKFKEGDIVFKARPYSENKYCKHGGSSIDVPIGTKGVIKQLDKDNNEDCIIDFDNGKQWHVSFSEINLVKKAENVSDIEKLTKYMVYGTGCDNKSMFYKTPEEAIERAKKVVDNSDWSGRIICYKLVPICETIKDIKVKNFKDTTVKKPVKKAKGQVKKTK